MYEFKGSEKDINIETSHPEFSDYKWVKPDFLVPNIVPFKKAIYEKLLKEFKIINIINADEFDGIDEFKNGDSFSKIAWKKSIISDKRYVKTFSDTEKLSNLILDLDKYPHIEF